MLHLAPNWRGRVRFIDFRFKKVDGWIGYYLGENTSYVSGIWRKVYVCPLPFLCFKFEVYRPNLALTPHGIEKFEKDEIRAYMYSAQEQVGEGTDG